MTRVPSTPSARPAARALVAAAALVALTGCAGWRGSAAYYWDTATGHLRVLEAARPIDDWLADPATPPALRERLAMAQRIRAWASAALALPGNASYRRYADLRRAAVVWNVVAAPEDSLTLVTSCFPVAGCVGYRGYYQRAAAEAEVARLAARGLESAAYGVPAYSTLGWSNWLGGDPLLNTFIALPPAELAGLVFHELAHQVAYAAGDTTFNESFATAVERLGVDAWLAGDEAPPQARDEHARHAARQRDFQALTRATHARLQAIYARRAAGCGPRQAPGDTRWRVAKAAAMDDFRARYAALRGQWEAQPGANPREWAGYDRWVARANNATFGTLAAYDALVPAFEALHARIAAIVAPASPWPAFHAEVRRLARLPKAGRWAALGAQAPAAEGEAGTEGETGATKAGASPDVCSHEALSIR